MLEWRMALFICSTTLEVSPSLEAADWFRPEQQHVAQYGIARRHCQDFDPLRTAFHDSSWLINMERPIGTKSRHMDWQCDKQSCICMIVCMICH